MHIAAITQPVENVTNLLIQACEQFKFSIFAASCYEEFSGIGGLGPYWAQLFAKMSQATGDMQAFCYYSYDVCDAPPVIEINEDDWFSPKPSGLVAPEPSGETINVLHLSDWHLDSRYDIGSEANCSGSLCCRPYSVNPTLNTNYTNPSVPASRFGNLFCDSPADLAISVFSEMPNFVNMSGISFSIFTGDIVSHDNDDQLSRAYVEYEETVTYQTFKAHLGNIVFPPSKDHADDSPFTPHWATMILSQNPTIRPTVFAVTAVKMPCLGIISSFPVFGNPQVGLTNRQPIMHQHIMEHMHIQLLKV